VKRKHKTQAEPSTSWIAGARAHVSPAILQSHRADARASRAVAPDLLSKALALIVDGIAARATVAGGTA
jgi:hypothetical protein